MQAERDRTKQQEAAAAVEEIEEEEEEPPAHQPTPIPSHPAAPAGSTSHPDTNHPAAAAPTPDGQQASTMPAAPHAPTTGVHRLTAAHEHEEAGGLEIRHRPIPAAATAAGAPTDEPEVGGLQIRHPPASTGTPLGTGTMSSHVRGMVARTDGGKQGGARASPSAPSKRGLLTREEIRSGGATPHQQGLQGSNDGTMSADDQVSFTYKTVVRPQL